MHKKCNLSVLVFIILVLVSVSGFAQDEYAYYDQKVKTTEEYYIYVKNGVDWVWGMECLVTDFTSSRTAQIAPGSGDPGFSDNILLRSDCEFPWLDGQVVFAFNVQFNSLQQLGTWTITCHGYGAVPLWYDGYGNAYGCEHYGCSLTCHVEVVYELSNNVILHITAWNDPPTASITHSPTPAWNRTVTLRANASDPDGGSLNYTWSVIQRPPGSTKTLNNPNSANPTITFNNDDDIGTWRFQLHVDDDEGERRTFPHQFNVPNVCPDISISGPRDIYVLDSIDLHVTPTTDEDGGNLDIVWDIVETPLNSSFTPQSNFYTGSSLPSITTTENDIGTWRFKATATDDEDPPCTVDRPVTVVVNNLEPEIDLVGNRHISIGDTIRVETTILEDRDGGDLIFQWDIIQVPRSSAIVPQENFSGGSGGAGFYVEIPTGYDDAGTWIIRLVATDNEGDWVDDEYTVLVDGPAEADISGPDTIGSLSFPLVLDGSGSLDPDSPCPGEADRCHDTLDGRPVAGISPGINWYYSGWSLIDVSLSDTSTGYSDYYPLGGVDEVFGIPAHQETLNLDFDDMEPGVWTFQLDVIDAEGNEDSVDHTVTIIDAAGPPVAVTNGPARYIIDASGLLSQDIPLSGYWSFDLDNLLVGDPFGPGLGISDYQWTVVNAPAGCTPPSLPSGPGQDTITLYDSGDVVDSSCQGIWNIQLTVTDDDSPARTDDAVTTVIIGNCPEPICIDCPTQVFPEFVEFVEGTDIFIYYHLDSLLYDEPIFATGLLTMLEIFHESDLVNPVYTSYDPSVLASDKGGFLQYRWNGYSSSHQRPQPGKYTIKITLLDSSFSVTPFADTEPEAIRIAVAEPSILPTSDRFIDFDALDSVSGDTVNFDYSVTGTAVPDQVCWRVRDDSGALKFERTEAFSGSIVWDGQVGGSTLIAGVYTVEVELLRGGYLLGTSDEFFFVVYRISMEPATGILPIIPPALVPDQLVRLNIDDDNSNGVVDNTENGPLAGENDLEEMTLVFEPVPIGGVPPELASSVKLTAFSGGGNIKVWDTQAKNNEIALDAIYNLISDIPPAHVFVEGIATGDTELRWVLEDLTTGTVVAHKSVTIHVINVDLDVDTNMDGTINLQDDNNEMNDQAIIININNNDSDADGNPDHLNNSIDGVADQAELTDLWLRQTQFVPPGGRMELRVSDKTKLRIFDDTGAGVIGPPIADGGPNNDRFTVPTAKIGGGDLNYLIECFNHGNVTIGLVALDSGGSVVSSDELKVVLNVDQTPTGGDTRFRINVAKNWATTTLEGIRGRITTPKAKVNWAPNIRKFSSTNVWYSVQDMATATGDYWMQTGLTVERVVGGLPVEAVYFEVATHYGSAGAAHYFQLKPKGGPPNPWPATGLYSVAIEDFATGEIVTRVDGVVWDRYTHAEWKTRKLPNYQLGSELFHSVDQNPGTSANHCTLADTEVLDASAWTATAISAGDPTFDDYDKNGNIINPAVSHEWEFSGVNPQGFEMWDKVVEY